MILHPESLPIKHLPLERLISDAATDFALSPTPEALTRSIAQLGVQTPLVACPFDDHWQVFMGHRRLASFHALGRDTVPVRVMDPVPGNAEKLLMQLQDNRPHRIWSDIEIGRALILLKAENLDETRLLDEALPLLNQEPSRKRLQDFCATSIFSNSLQTLLHEINLPLRTYSTLFRWTEEDRDVMESLLSILRPGAGKCRDLLELIDEGAHRDGTTPAARLRQEDIQKILNETGMNVGERYQAIHLKLFEWRYPHLSEMRVRVRQALEQMKLDGRIRMRVPENFESDEMKVEFTFRSRQEFIDKVESLFRLTDHAALDDLLNIFKS